MAVNVKTRTSESVYSDTERAASSVRNSNPVVDDTTFPLYVSTLVAMLAAFIAIEGIVGDTNLAIATNIIAITGYIFAFWYRRKGFPLAPLNWTFGAVAVLLAVGLMTGWIDFRRLVSTEIVQGDILLAIGLQCIAALSSFVLIDDKRLLMSSILAMAMIGLVATYDVNGILVVDFFVYMVATVFLLLNQSYHLFSPWGATKLTPERTQQLIKLQLGFAFGAAIVSIALGGVLVVPIEAVGSKLSLANALKSLARLEPAAVAPSYVTQDIIPTIDQDDSTFAIGQGPTSDGNNGQVLLSIDSLDGEDHYWRGRTYDHYTGTGWISSLKEPVATTGLPATSKGDDYYYISRDPADDGISPKVKLRTVRIVVERRGLDSSTLYLPPTVNWIETRSIGIFQFRLHGDGLLESIGPYRVGYFVAWCKFADVSPSALFKIVSPVYPNDIKQNYIFQKGDNVAPADSALMLSTAANIINGIPKHDRNEMYEVLAIKNWVAHQCLYSLDVNPTPDGKDAVTYFLFNQREGYCDLFASSMALLCRYAGIPARVATGFAPGHIHQGNSVLLTDADRHAWCEVYFPGYGWQTFDPTEGTVLAPTQSIEAKLLALIKSMINPLILLLNRAGLVPALLICLITVALIAIVVTEVGSSLAKRRANRAKLANMGFDKESELGRSRLARYDAKIRWNAMIKSAERWRRKPFPSETCAEYVASLTAEISRVATDSAPSGVTPPYDSDKVISAVMRLSEDYLMARYEAESRVNRSLMQRNESGAAKADLDLIASVADGLPKNLKSAAIKAEPRFVYSLKRLSPEPSPRSVELSEDSRILS